MMKLTTTKKHVQIVAENRASAGVTQF